MSVNLTGVNHGQFVNPGDTKEQDARPLMSSVSVRVSDVSFAAPYGNADTISGKLTCVAVCLSAAFFTTFIVLWSQNRF